MGVGRVVGGSASSSSTGASPNRPDRLFHRDTLDEISQLAANAAHRNLPAGANGSLNHGNADRVRTAGGHHAARPTTAQFNNQKEGWTQVSSNPSTSGRPPCQRSLHAAAMLRDSMYVFGGYDGLHRVNDLYEYHFTSRSWRQIITVGSLSEVAGAVGVGVVTATGTAPSPRDRHTAVAHGTSFYV